MSEQAAAPRAPAFCRRCGAVAQLSWKLLILTWEGACCTFHPSGFQSLEVGWCVGCWEPQPPDADAGKRLQEIGVDLFPGWEEARRRALEGVLQ